MLRSYQTPHQTIVMVTEAISVGGADTSFRFIQT